MTWGKNFFKFSILILAVILGNTMLFSPVEAGLFGLGGGSRPERNVASFEKEGRYWGERLKGKKPMDSLNQEFVTALRDPENIGYFTAHSDLKDAFKKGFRMGFEDRIADLVLGPHLTATAGLIGNEISARFVGVIKTFEDGWALTLHDAVEIFIVLISEGSQSDRKEFITNFISNYDAKYQATQKILKSHNYVAQMSEGGTMLFIDYSKGKSLGALDIPRTEALQTEIYHQTFKVMGDELGRRYSNNLIKRDELIDLLRRSKTALEEVPGNNLGIIYGAFIDSYGVDADNVFLDLVKAAGYKQIPTVYVMTPPKEVRNGDGAPKEPITPPKTSKKKR